MLSISHQHRLARVQFVCCQNGANQVGLVPEPAVGLRAVNRGEEARQAERPESRAQESARRKAEEGPKPVVNALGQTTGTLINIAA